MEQFLTAIENHGWLFFWLFLGLLALIHALRGDY